VTAKPPALKTEKLYLMLLGYLQLHSNPYMYIQMDKQVVYGFSSFPGRTYM